MPTPALRPRHRRPSRARLAWVAGALALPLLLPVLPAEAATGSVSGYVWDDGDRDGVRDAGESAFPGISMYLLDRTTGSVVAVSGTDSTGRFSLTAPTGEYRVTIAGASWNVLKDQWTPTTTGTDSPTLDVSASEDAAEAPIGLRRIVRSTTAPLTSFTGPSGLTVESYNDVATARNIHDLLASGLLGGEAADTIVKFDLDTTNHTSSSWSGTAGGYNGYASTVYASFRTWLDDNGASLTHEYGHAWSLYQAVIQRQDDTLAEYLRARGLGGDPRVGSTVYWQPREMVAEDYRQLFGTADAASRPQANTDIPVAGAVPGLREWLRDTFTTRFQAPSPSPTPTPTPPPTPPPTSAPLTISDLGASPVPVVSRTTVRAELSGAATVRLLVVDARGRIVRTLVPSVSRDAGAFTQDWDRRDDRGRKVKAGGYAVQLDATDAAGARVTASTDIRVV